MTNEPRPETPGLTDAVAVRRAVQAAAAWFVMAGALCFLAAPFEAMFKEVGVNLPKATEVVLFGVHALRAQWGLVPLILLVAFLTVVPLVIVPPNDSVRRWLRLALLQAVAVGLSAAFALTIMSLVDSVEMITCLCPPGCPHQGDGRFVSCVPIFAVGVAQLQLWHEVACLVSKQPRREWGVELARVAFLASAPGVILATIAAVAIDAVAPPHPAGLIVEVPTAAAGTALLAVVAVAITYRVRTSSKQPDTNPGTFAPEHHRLK